MVSKTTFKVRLNNLVDTKGLTSSDKEEIKDELSEFIIDKILADTSNERSAVTGQKWKSLGWNKGSKQYKKEKSKIASSKANLELTGRMLDALKAINYQGGIEIGIFDNDQAQKSDNHNKFSAKSQSTGVPQRQFIPKKGQTLRSGIMNDVVKIAKELVEAKRDEGVSRTLITSIARSLIGDSDGEN